MTRKEERQKELGISDEQIEFISDGTHLGGGIITAVLHEAVKLGLIKMTNV